MLRLFLIFILVQIGFFSVSAANNKLVVNEMILVDGPAEHRYNYLYTNQHLPQSETKWLKVNETWEKSSLKEWYYHENLPPTIVERKWTKNGWVDTCKIEFKQIQNGYIEIKYNAVNGIHIPVSKNEIRIQNNRVVHENRMMYQNEQWHFQNSMQYFFSTRHMPDSSIFTHNGNRGVENYKTSFTYNNDSTLQSVRVEHRIENSNWQNMSRSLYFHNNETKMPLYVRNEFWNSNTEAWEYFNKTEYEYADNKLINETYWIWNEMSWKQDLNYNYTYHNHMYDQIFTQASIAREWRNLSTAAYRTTTNQNQLTIQSNYNFWGGEMNSTKSDFLKVPFNNQTIIRKAEQITLNYTVYQATSTQPKPSDEVIVAVYPNPSNGIFYIQRPNSNHTHWQLFDLSGRIIRKSTNFSHTSIVDITDLANGMYVLRIVFENQIFTHKIVKEN